LKSNSPQHGHDSRADAQLGTLGRPAPITLGEVTGSRILPVCPTSDLCALRCPLSGRANAGLGAGPASAGRRGAIGCPARGPVCCPSCAGLAQPGRRRRVGLVHRADRGAAAAAKRPRRSAADALRRRRRAKALWTAGCRRGEARSGRGTRALARQQLARRASPGSQRRSAVRRQQSYPHAAAAAACSTTAVLPSLQLTPRRLALFRPEPHTPRYCRCSARPLLRALAERRPTRAPPLPLPRLWRSPLLLLLVLLLVLLL